MKSKLFLLPVFWLALSAQAWADPPYYRHHHRDHFHRPRTTVEFGFYFGPSWVYPPRPVYAYPAWPRVYAPPIVAPVIVSPPAPTVYIEQPAVLPSVPTLEPGYWYWCEEARAYYPYVKQCPGSWRKVAPQPPQ
ncbi:MAG: hypothetical protein N3C63_08015 [Rhodocyclaceae bacterium]|nr:hypothetical protein [Rhodocyclaceae bacterium]